MYLIEVSIGSLDSVLCWPEVGASKSWKVFTERKDTLLPWDRTQNLIHLGSTAPNPPMGQSQL